MAHIMDSFYYGPRMAEDLAQATSATHHLGWKSLVFRKTEIWAHTTTNTIPLVVVVSIEGQYPEISLSP